MTELVLASGSPARHALLARAGVAHVVRPADVDEGALKRALAGASVEAVAACLAEAKALAVAGGVVIGADTMVAPDAPIDGKRWLDKARDMAELRRQLQALRGRGHRLVTAAAVAVGGRIGWRHVAVVRMAMRDFSDGFLDEYLAAEGEKLLGSVGGYHIEGRGVQLFEAVEGDLFAVAGLPLVPLLGFLRAEGVIT